jgi:hypothetical protein
MKLKKIPESNVISVPIVDLIKNPEKMPITKQIPDS